MHMHRYNNETGRIYQLFSLDVNTIGSNIRPHTKKGLKIRPHATGVQLGKGKDQHL